MLQRIIAVVLAIPFAATALVMLFAPRAWYDAFPGVVETGPFNPHFVRDIGCAFLVVSAVLVAFVVAKRPPVSALIAGAAFVALHAFIHISELLDMPQGVGHALLRDLPGVYLPTLLTIWIAASAAARSRALDSAKAE
jgi:hypothetical protein